ncbi:MAG: hypothetical protein IKT27_00880 [Clostridia bacterium]|nr:hypothetical protein [Clostridia bacterium]
MKQFLTANQGDIEEYGLTCKEDIVLDYLKAFVRSGRMYKVEIDDEVFYEISYRKILEDLPIVGSRRSLAYVLRSLEDKGALRRATPSKQMMVFQIDNYTALN